MIEESMIEKLIQEPSTGQQSMDNGSIFVRSPKVICDTKQTQLHFH